MQPIDQLEEELRASQVARVTVAEKWTSCVCLCVFLVCATAVTLGLVALLHG
jgi:hypothetical protein